MSDDMGSLSEIFKSMPGLTEVEEVVRSKFKSDAPLLREIPGYLLDLGGKRIRPILSLLVGQASGLKGTPPRELIEIAAGIELIHMATLLHDDIIDKSPKRRKEASPFSKFGLPCTLLAGDFLLVRAFSLCAHLDTFIIEKTEQACVELTEGEILELPLYEKRHSLESSLMVARKKTASLFRLAAETAAHLGEMPESSVQHFARFGETLGLAFQILDDLLDVTGDEASTGKVVGSDLREKKPSVINVLWLESGAAESEWLTLPPSPQDEARINPSLELLRGSSVVSHARDLAIENSNLAKRALFEATKGHSGCEETVLVLEQLCGYIVSRAS